MQQEAVGYVDAVSYSICGKSYHMMDIKDTDYVILMMTTLGTLENLEG